MSTEEHDLTIRVETSESYYDGDAYASATLTFSSDGKSVKLDYETSTSSLDRIMPDMLKDIEACIDDPDAWIANAIKQGPESIEKLREYEQELSEAEHDIKDYTKRIAIKSKIRDEYQKKVDELKERMKQ